MRIQKVKIHNFKGIKDLEKDLDCNHIILLGDNGVGKSSFLQAITSALGSKKNMPVHPVSEGEKEGEVIVWTENGYRFEMDMDGKKGSTKIVAFDPNGMKTNLKSAISSIVGNIDFDIFKFVEQSSSEKGKKEQVEFVRSLLDEETQAQLKRFELNIKANYDSRTEFGREKKRLEGVVASSDVKPEDVKKYTKPVDVHELQMKYDAISKKNTEIADVETRYAERAKQIEELLEKQKKAEAYLAENEKVDTTELSNQISTASEHNVMVEKVKAYLKEEEALTKVQNDWEDCEVLVNSQRQALTDFIKSMPLPVDGLEFTEECLLYDGREVDINTMSTAEIMHLGIMLHIAINPNVKIIVVPRGESLGIERRKAIVELADKYGYQILMEQVQPGTMELKVEFLIEK